MVKPSSQHDNVVINVPFGSVGIHIQSDYVVGIELFPSQQQTHEATSQFTQYVAHQMSQYFQQADSELDIPYALAGTPFQKRVWSAISDIPAGKVLTYSELAQRVGSGPRAVANACGANKIPLLIPCHRVVAKNGLGGFMQGVDGGLKIKEWLLAYESK
jgi:methylated-DNA-[protein]-cysteine S-methyltransferase